MLDQVQDLVKIEDDLGLEDAERLFRISRLLATLLHHKAMTGFVQEGSNLLLERFGVIFQLTEILLDPFCLLLFALPGLMLELSFDHFNLPVLDQKA